jgi:type II secretory pathway component GspD/PulD (secretin)
MRWLGGVLLALVTTLALCGQEAPKTAPTSDAASGGAASPSNAQSATPAATVVAPPTTSKKEVAEAKREFASGMKLKSAGNIQEALEKFESASQLDPRNVAYLTAREMTRQQLVMEAVERGNKEMLAGHEVAAAAEFRRALEIDPTNDYSRQRVRDSAWEVEKVPTRTLQVAQNSIDAQLSPSTERTDFHYKGDSRTLLTQVARAYGITATIDDSVQTRPLHFNIDDVNFAEAMEAATQVTKTFWIPLSGSQMYLVADTVENRKNFERLAIRTYYLNDVLAPPELMDIVSALRQLLDIRIIQQDAAESTITIRAPLAMVEAATQMIESLAGGRPQLMLDVRVYQISSSLVRQLGTQLPTNFNMFNLSPAVLASLIPGGVDAINQLIASGGINQANSQAIQALLAQLQSAAQQNPLLTTPFATFGGGQTLTGVSATPPIAVNLQVNESDVKNLEHVTLRAAQNSPAVMRVGERYPIVNATFAPIYNSSAISQVIGNQSYIPPVPSINYEDLGLNLKATPIIHSNTDVSLTIELNFRSLGEQSVNGVPIINNREYVGSITLKNNESGVVAGLMSKADALSLSGYPFLSRVPGINYGTSVQNKNVNKDELLIVMTPHIVRMAPQVGFAVQIPTGH